ncbi:MAG: hypothetical protein R6X08_04830 [Desulfosalsimonadaceae bacterium]
MDTIAGTVMVVYAGILQDILPNVMGHILTASILSAPAAVVISKIMVPGTEGLTSAELKAPEQAYGSMDAITRGALRGYESKDGRTSKTFEALDWLLQLTTHIPNRREQMVRCYSY